MFVEDRFQHSGSRNGLSRAMGLTFAPAEHWTLAANWELGTFIDRETAAETERRAGGASVGYRTEDANVTLALEYRNDESELAVGGTEERTTWLFKNHVRYQVTDDWRAVIGKFHHSRSDSSLGEAFDGGYTEAVSGLAYRPVAHDRLDVLAKYTWFENMPTLGQMGSGGGASQFLQRSHVASLDVSYDLTSRWAGRRQVRVSPRRGEPRPRRPGLLRQQRAPVHPAHGLRSVRRLGSARRKGACSTCPTSTSVALVHCSACRASSAIT